jgi:hypothetical protein
MEVILLNWKAPKVEEKYLAAFEKEAHDELEYLTKKHRFKFLVDNCKIDFFYVGDSENPYSYIVLDNGMKLYKESYYDTWNWECNVSDYQENRKEIAKYYDKYLENKN